MEYNQKWNFPKMQPWAVYDSIVTSEGMLVIPQDCLTGMFLDGTTVVLTNSLDKGAIALYTPNAFDDVKSNLGCLNSMDRMARALKMRIIGEALDIKINKGNIEIPAEYMESLGLSFEQTASRNHTSFNVKILKYPEKIEIYTIAAYQNIRFETENVE